MNKYHTSNKIFIFSILFLILINPCMGQDYIENSNFTTDLSNWSLYTSGTASTKAYDRPTSGGWDGSPYIRVRVLCSGDTGQIGTATAYQSVDVTGYSKLEFKGKSTLTLNDPNNEGGYNRVYVGSDYIEFPANTGWTSYEIDLTVSGVQDVEIVAYAWDNTGSYYGTSITYVDNIILTGYDPNKTIDGYVTKSSNGDPLESASICLNNSGGSAASNESGYYTISDIPPGIYSISVTRSGFADYIDVITISDNIEKNISMSYSIPTIESLSILDAGDNSLLLGWKESIGADGVYIYVDSQEQIFTTVLTPYTNVKMYDLTNLEPGTAYNIWCKPFKDTLEGSMYYVSGATAGDGGGSGGGGGGGAVEVLPPYEDIQPEIPEYPEAYDITNITSSDLITLAATNPEVIFAAISNISIKSPSPGKPGDNLLYFYSLVISICSTLLSSKKEGWEVVTIISIAVVVISLIKLGWI